MTAYAEIRGTDVIGIPGQNLNSAELFVLVGIADGTPAQKIAEELNVDHYAVRDVEAAVQAKLGAKNKAHMITRGFTLGVLVPNALCMLLALCAVLEIDHTFTRPRTPRRQRGGAEVVRVLRMAPSGGRAAPARAALYV